MNGKKIISIIMTFIALQLTAQSGFKTRQMQFERVKTAYKEKEKQIQTHLKTFNLKLNKLEILLMAYKKERKLELWAKDKLQEKYQLINTYDFSSFSGKLGPKRKQGDGQIPEGIYQIERFNPASNFYLSLGINYPNASDKIKSNASDLGGDIFIHGNNVTIGCIPITDDKIKELYVYAIEARNSGQTKIQVAIFPCKLDKDGVEKLQKDYASQKALLSFWEKLQDIYQYFHTKKHLPKISIDENGDYIYK
jgi:murein L,D-transpeptidase YafK